MVIINILCEGPTEENFVKKVLSPYFRSLEAIVKPRQVTTNRKLRVTGGMTSYAKIKNDFEYWRRENSRDMHNHHIYTSMFDYYQLPVDFPGFPPSGNDAMSRVIYLEHKLAENLDFSAFLPYIQLHGFEALVFAGLEYLKIDHPNQDKVIKKLEQELQQCGRKPENVNNRPETAPSKRLIAALGKYNKTKTGPMVTAMVGINGLKAQCPHFRGWIEKLEKMVKEIR